MLYSTEHQMSPPFPSCLDYTRQMGPNSNVIDLMGHSRRFVPRSIGEDKESGRAHILNMSGSGSGVHVITYSGYCLFSYPLSGALPHISIRPRGIAISNSFVFITDLRNQMLFIFTLEGDVVTFSTCADNYVPEARLKRPRGITADDDNNIYVCQANDLQAYSATLPVHQTFGSHEIGRPKDVHLYRDMILVLSWTAGVSIFALSTSGIVLSEIKLGDHTRPSRPWYFDLDHQGNILVITSRDSKLHMYSQDGSFMDSVEVIGMERARGIKLLNNKSLIAVTGYGKNSVVIF